MNTSIFNAYSKYYDLLYMDKDYFAEARYIQNLLVKYGVNRGSLLEFGSGTGKHGVLLVDQGYVVHGVELSFDMVSQASKADNFTCQQGDIRHIKLGQYFDAVISLFHVISYQTTNEDLSRVFGNANTHLKKNGLFIFDFWYGPAVNTQQPSVRVKRMSDEKVEIIRLAEPVTYWNENRVDVNYTIFVRDLSNDACQKIVETHSMRHFSLLELDLIAVNHGFERIGAEEFLSANIPSENTWGVCVVFKKI